MLREARKKLSFYYPNFYMRSGWGSLLAVVTVFALFQRARLLAPLRARHEDTHILPEEADRRCQSQHHPDPLRDAQSFVKEDHPYQRHHAQVTRLPERIQGDQIRVAKL